MGSRWVAPGVSPVQFLDDSGFLDARVLAVHGVQMTPADLARLAARGATLVTCPRSNGHTGAGAPPIEDFYASGVRVAVGTDSLASAPDLNVFAELATMRALAPSVPASALLDERDAAGRARARLRRRLTARSSPASARACSPSAIPPGIDDVEEYLVSGIQPGADPMDRAGTCRRWSTRAGAPTCRSSASATRCSRCRLRWPARCWRRAQSPMTWATVGWILVAMVAARSAAMGFNRLVDARFDALNPRTANREIPRGAMSHARGRRVRRRRVARSSSTRPGG